MNFKRNLMSIFMILMGSVTIGQLPQWPLVTGFVQSGPTANTTSTTPHQFVDWTNPNPTAVNIPNGASNRHGATQAGFDACGEMVFFVLHNGEQQAANAELELYTPQGQLINLPNGNPNANSGDDEIQVVRRPGQTNQWFIIYNLAPQNFPNNPAYQCSFLVYSLIELNGTQNNITANYVTDNQGAIQDRPILVNGNQFRYVQGKAMSRNSISNVPGAAHDLYVQRRTQPWGSTNIDTTFIVDHFAISTSDQITYVSSSGVVNSYTFPWLAAGSPIEISPDNRTLAVMARSQTDDQQEIYLFDITNLGTFNNSQPANIIDISQLEIEFPTPPAVLPLDSHYQAQEFDAPNGTGFDWLRHYERKVSNCEFSPSGQYLYIVGGGYFQAANSNLTYLTQINLDPATMIGGNYTARVQVQTTDDNNSFDPTDGGGPTWTQNNRTNLWNYHPLARIQSSLDGNLYFTKGRDTMLYVLPNPDSLMPINMTPTDIDFSTAQDPNILTTGYVNFMPDQIDGHNYSTTNFVSTFIDVSSQSFCSCDSTIVHLVNSSTQDTAYTYEITDCPQTIIPCLNDTVNYDLHGENGQVYTDAVVNGNVNYPSGSSVFSFVGSSSSNINFTTVTNTLINSDEVWDGKYYIPDNTIVTVNNAELDLTNCDLVFGQCSGFDFVNGATLRANNSVFRPCEINGTWRGLRFTGPSENDHIINECTFKNAEIALYFRERADGVVSNGLFSNCNHGIRAEGNERFNHPISGNRFVVDDFYPQFVECYAFTDVDFSYGIRAINVNFTGEISHNDFIDSRDEPIAITGIDMNLSGGHFSENRFTNNTNAIVSIRPIYDNRIENNEIEFNSEFVQPSIAANPAGGIFIADASGRYIKVSGNEIVNDPTSGALFAVFSRNISNMSASNNTIDNFPYGILMDRFSSIEITNNVIKNTRIIAIGLQEMVDQDRRCFVTCNDITHSDDRGIHCNRTSRNLHVTSNCVKDCRIAIDYLTPNTAAILPYTRNNYLYNYTIGINNDGHAGDIGTSADPGINTLWSNNNSAIDIASTTNIQVADNFGMFNISFPQVQITSNNPFHSTASCGHQIFNMPSQGNLNPDLICDNGTGVRRMLFVDGNTGNLKSNYIDLIKKSEDASALMKTVALNYTNASEQFVQSSLNQLSLTSIEEADVLYDYYVSQDEYDKAKDVIINLEITSSEIGRFKELRLVEINTLRSNSVSTNQLDALTELKGTEYHDQAVFMLRTLSNKHDHYNVQIDELEPVQTADFKTQRIENDQLSIQVYPNPASDELFVEAIVNQESENNLIEIYDTRGQLIKQIVVKDVVSRIKINVSDLSSGLYILTLKSDQTFQTKAKFTIK